ncbi:hypothetical protein FSB08_40130 [Paraburkholderia sp. JPY432]|nr:hypothetical protein [Paraburkholderia youngii]
MERCRLFETTLQRRAGCAERRTSGSGRRGREIVRLRPVSYSAPRQGPVEVSLPGRGQARQDH